MISALKWFALVLVFFNIAYLVTAIVGPEGGQDIKKAGGFALEGKKIKLLSELTPEERAKLQPVEPLSPGSREVDSEEGGNLLASEPYCPSLGPFESKAKLVEVGKLLAKSGLSGKSRAVVLDSSEKYRVYLQPYEDYKAASDALKKLRAKKIDSYIMTEKPLENAISLGIFSSRDSAEGLARKMNSYGYQAKILPTLLDKEAFWLDLNKPSNPEKVDQVLISVMASTDGVTRVDSPCKVVALAQ